MLKYFLRIEGFDSKGTSTAERHLGEIELLSYSFGAPAAMPRGTGSGAGKVDLTQINFFKYRDITTSDFYNASVRGHHFDSAVLTVEKISDKGNLIFFQKFEMK